MRMETSQTYLTAKDGSTSCWTNRTRKEKRLFLVVLLLVPAVLALAIAVFIISNDYRLYREEVGGSKGEAIVDGNITICTTPECVETAASMLELMDLTTDPCENFEAFACGRWSEAHPMPDDKGRFSQFDIISTKIAEEYKKLLNEPTTKSNGSAIYKVTTMYHMCRNETQVYNTTVPTLLDILQNLGGWPILSSDWSGSHFDWLTLHAIMERNPLSPIESPSAIIQTEVTFDTRNTSRKLLYFDQPSLILDRDYLINADNYTTIIEAHKKLITRIALYLGKGNVSEDRVRMDVEDMLALETNMAKISLSPAERRDSFLTTNYMTVGQLYNLTQNKIDWLHYLNILFKNVTTFVASEEIIVGDKNYFAQMAGLIQSTSNRTMANYMLFKHLLPSVIHMSPETQGYLLDYVKVMAGVSQATPRWKTCTKEADKGMGQALGSLYVKTYFPEKSKEAAKDMISYIRKTFRSMLKSEKWMDAETKQKAEVKLEAMSEKIGYPDWILNEEELDEYFENITVTKGNYLVTLASAAGAGVLEEILTLREYPADKSRWSMTPGTVNAYYSRSINSINFPAGILQAPFFSSFRPQALNFGGIGSVIGHEITHGFDDQGRLYDENGNLHSWWTNDSSIEFQKLAQCYVNQYNDFCPSELNGICVNGNLTLGENIADNGGIKAAYEGYQLWKSTGEQKHEIRLPGLEHYTMDQLFFLSFGQVWCAESRKQMMRNLIFRDPHSPPQYRILGVLEDSAEFSDAYRCKKGSAMNLGDNRCVLW